MEKALKKLDKLERYLVTNKNIRLEDYREIQPLLDGLRKELL